MDKKHTGEDPETEASTRKDDIVIIPGESTAGCHYLPVRIAKMAWRDDNLRAKLAGQASSTTAKVTQRGPVSQQQQH